MCFIWIELEQGMRRSQIKIVWSTDAVHKMFGSIHFKKVSRKIESKYLDIRLLSGWNLTRSTVSLWPAKVKISLPGPEPSTLHILANLSTEPDASFDPWQFHATLLACIIKSDISAACGLHDLFYLALRKSLYVTLYRWTHSCIVTSPSRTRPIPIALSLLMWLMMQKV